jgi:hypothetical protein
MPKLLNRHHPNPPTSAVYVGRGTPFGNIYEYPRHGTREQCVQKFAAWLATQPELIERIRTELVGKDLVCSCWPKRCHAEILLAIANNEVIQPVAQIKEQVQMSLFN